MKAQEIIAALARDKGVEKMASVVLRKRGNPAHIEDLCQDVYIALLEKDTAFVERAYEEGWFGWWVLGVVKRMAMPKSAWSYMWDKHEQRNLPITEEILNMPDE